MTNYLRIISLYLVGGLMFDLVRVDFTELVTTKLCTYDHHFRLNVHARNKMCELGSTQTKEIPAKQCISLDVSAEFTASSKH